MSSTTPGKRGKNVTSCIISIIYYNLKRRSNMRMKLKSSHPKNTEKNAFSGNLRIVDMETAAAFKRIDKDVRPGQKLCVNCSSKLTAASNESSSTENEDTDPFDREIAGDVSAINASFTAIECSPMKVAHVSSGGVVAYAKRKVSEVTSVVQRKVSKLVNVPSSALAEEPVPSCSNECPSCGDIDDLVKSLKAKCDLSTRQEKVQILTAVPQSWTIEETIKYFNVSHRVVKQARSLKTSKGIFAEPDSKKGKNISEELKQKVIECYQKDEYARMCPGKKDFVSVRVGGERVHMQKRLLLQNLNELHTEFKKMSDCNISLSKFCELRPKWCVTVGARGTHSVCVCQSHQNTKLLLSVLPGPNVHYIDIIRQTVCDIENHDCMLHRCQKCPGKELLAEFLDGVFKDHDLDGEDVLVFKQWVHTDRTSLVTIQETVNGYIDKLCMAVHDLAPHHYIAKSQASYLRHLKETIPENEAIILLDFAENYSFIIQDAVQGHHWDNSQATLHPFVVYYRREEKLECLSICVISDCLTHNTVTVHKFLHPVIEYVKTSITGITKIIYLSDGAASQYKNYKNFKNLGFHKTDSGCWVAFFCHQPWEISMWWGGWHR